METLLPAGLLLLCGVAWKIADPGGITSTQMRQQLNLLNIYLLIPGMVLAVILRSPVSGDTWLLPVAAWLVIGTCLLLNTLTYRHLLKATPDPTKGAMVLAGSFGNGVGLAAPVVIAVYGLEAARVPILYTLLGSLPMTWTLGVAISLGHAGHRVGPMWHHLLRSPPLWAVLGGLAIIASPYSLPAPLNATLEMLTQAAVPLMLFTVGLSLNLKGFTRIRVALPAIFSKSIISPVVALIVGHLLGLEGSTLGALVVTAATASFNVGVVLSDRYNLDVELYGVTVAVTAVLFFCLLPIWSWLLGP